MLLQFNGRGILQLSVIQYFIKEIFSQSELDRYNKVFICMNSSHTGILTRLELLECYQRLKYKDASMFHIDVIFQLLDSNGVGMLEFYKVLIGFVDPSIFLQRDKLIKAFKAFDSDGGGSVSVEEIQNFLSPNQKLADNIWCKVLGL